ncbi:MAG: NTP transferase domain-containing protein [Methanomicrobia archaeon]|nr:NTP transferase domain-containing protein [Methanomicrobia archaeon]
MKALIIAAGGSTRLRPLTSKVPKTLLNVGERKIIDLILDPLISLGMDIFIVTGYYGEKVKRYVKKNYEWNISFIHNSDWREGNGISVLRSEKYLKKEDKFLLLMSDHVFNPGFLRDFIDLDPQECYLCVDKDLKNVSELEEATKVYIEKDRILDIGKEISYYNAVDCGVFLTTPYIFDVLKENTGIEKTVNSAMKKLSSEGNLYAYDITGNFWIDIDTEKDLRMLYELVKTYGWDNFQTYK